MTALVTVAVVWGVIMLTAWAICADSRRREQDAFDRHVEQAVNVIDDGKVLADEAEDYLRRRTR